MNLFSRGVRNAFRNATRSISIIVILGLAIGLCLVMLVARQAVVNRIATLNSSVGNTINITPAGYNNFSSVNNALTTGQLSKVAKLAHISALTESLTDRLTTNGAATFGSSSSSGQTSLTSPVKLNRQATNGRGPGLFTSGGSFSPPTNFSLPITIIGTNDPSSVSGTTVVIQSGQTISGSANTNRALLSSAMATKNNIKVNSSFSAYGQTLTVSGIYKNSGSLSNDVIVSLPTEQRLSGQSNDVTSAVATVDSLANINTAAKEIRNSLGSSATITTSLQQAQNATAPLNNIRSISLYSLVGATLAAVIIIFLIMIMTTRERRREIGILKALGATNVKVALQFMVEAATLTIAGAIIGIIIGVAAASPITHMLVKNETTQPGSTSNLTRGPAGTGFRSFSGRGNFRFQEDNSGSLRGIRNSITNVQAVVGWSIVLYGLGGAIVIALIGSSASAFIITKVRPAEVLRQE